MAICDCGAYIQTGVQCSQCELEERYDYDSYMANQCGQCGAVGIEDSFCDECRAGFGERTPQSKGGGE